MPGLQFAPLITALALLPVTLLTAVAVVLAGRTWARWREIAVNWRIGAVVAAVTGLFGGQVLRVLPLGDDLTVPGWIVPLTGLAGVAALVAWLAAHSRPPTLLAAVGPLVAAAALIGTLAGFLVVPVLPPADAIRHEIACSRNPYAAECEPGTFHERTVGSATLSVLGVLGTLVGNASAVCTRSPADGSAEISATFSWPDLELDLALYLRGDAAYEGISLTGRRSGVDLTVMEDESVGSKVGPASSWRSGTVALDRLFILLGPGRPGDVGRASGPYDPNSRLFGAFTWTCSAA